METSTIIWGIVGIIITGLFGLVVWFIKGTFNRLEKSLDRLEKSSNKRVTNNECDLRYTSVTNSIDTLAKTQEQHHQNQTRIFERLDKTNDELSRVCGALDIIPGGN